MKSPNSKISDEIVVFIFDILSLQGFLYSFEFFGNVQCKQS